MFISKRTIRKRMVELRRQADSIERDLYDEVERQGVEYKETREFLRREEEIACLHNKADALWDLVSAGWRVQVGRFSIGRHAMHNKWPKVLHYWRPRQLLMKHTIQEQRLKIWKWMWIYIAVEGVRVMDRPERTVRFRQVGKGKSRFDKWQVLVWDKGSKRPRGFYMINMVENAHAKKLEPCCNCPDKFYRHKDGSMCYHEVEFMKYMQKLINDGLVEGQGRAEL